MTRRARPTGSRASGSTTVAPAGTPIVVIKRLNEEIGKAVKSRDIDEKLQADGSRIISSSPEELEKNIPRQEMADLIGYLKGEGE